MLRCTGISRGYDCLVRQLLVPRLSPFFHRDRQRRSTARLQIQRSKLAVSLHTVLAAASKKLILKTTSRHYGSDSLDRY